MSLIIYRLSVFLIIFTSLGYTERVSKIGISAAPKPPGLTIASRPIFLILGDLRSSILGSFRVSPNPIFETRSVYTGNDKDFPRISPEERGRFYMLMMEVDQILCDHQIPYWGISGTLLGAIRHGGMIPWDDDIDLILVWQNRFQLEALLPVFRKQGLELVNFRNCIYKIFPINGDSILDLEGKELPWKYPFVDIFLANRLNGKFRIVSVSNPLNDIYPDKNGKAGWSLLFEELRFPIERTTFGPMQLPIPHNATVILKREYGDDCLNAAYLQYSHKDEKPLNSSRVQISDFSPPEYVLPQLR